MADSKEVERADTELNWLAYIALSFGILGYVWEILYVGITKQTEGISLWWPMIGMCGGVCYIIFSHVNNITPGLITGSGIIVGNTIMFVMVAILKSQKNESMFRVIPRKLAAIKAELRKKKSK